MLRAALKQYRGDPVATLNLNLALLPSDAQCERDVHALLLSAEPEDAHAICSVLVYYEFQPAACEFLQAERRRLAADRELPGNASDEKQDAAARGRTIGPQV